ncbi:MAG: aminotransferase class I/II-fold pyridoxal phosphate-dependent enzyme [Candidatus Eisenbacteria bacterium]|nr:aminotransferase class I/II-fold pyridoxal phosphate-dependent enzyme [Candidatus Latescibacterota bacterium]MBD3301239.1 aminotransferase class I/II-fold pyridoxal phosphate-dependent enzyme [Candidatus Eisenbacteria bacterium]
MEDVRLTTAPTRPLEDLRIDRQSETPVYLQIVHAIRERISAGALPVGTRLPPERKLAEELGVNRSTVFQAYRELKERGLLGARVGSGTVVLPPQVTSADPALRGRAIPWNQLFRAPAASDPDPLLRDLLSLTEREDLISFAVGLPSPDCLPIADVQRIFAELSEEAGASLYLHCPTEGHTPLREALSVWADSRGIETNASELLVLSGSQQGLDLAARVFLSPGDAVVVEEPTYIGALHVFRDAGARLLSVPADADGMRTDLLANLLEKNRPKLIYTLPTFQNPSGSVLSLERRRHLLDLSLRHQVPILEDDPYSELRYEGEPLPSLRGMEGGESVLHLSTFSKLLLPGLRVGWLVAPPPVIRRFALAKQSIDLHTNTVAQMILDRFVREGLLEAHLEMVRSAYRKKRDLIHSVLSVKAPAGLSWRSPQGGFYVWGRLPDGIDSSRLLGIAADAGVAYLPGWPCFAAEGGERYFRLNFTYPEGDRIVEGVERLMQAIETAALLPEAGRKRRAGTPPIV